MGSGPGRMRDEEREAAEEEARLEEQRYLKMLEEMSVADINLIISSAWYVVRAFEQPATVHKQSASLEMLKQHLKRVVGER